MYEGLEDKNDADMPEESHLLPSVSRYVGEYLTFFDLADLPHFRQKQ